MKIKVTGINQSDLKDIKERNLKKAKDFYRCAPYTTKIYMALKTKLPLTFISDNWSLIIE